MNWLISLFGGGIAGELRRAYEARLQAKNDSDRLALDSRIADLQAMQEAARRANEDRWSATSLGRYLVVLPFGLWLTAVIVVSIVNPNFGTSWVIHDLPPRIWDLMQWLFPAIIVGTAIERFRR